MKKPVLVLILLILCAALSAFPADYRFRAMGNIQAAGTANPASIYFHDQNDFFSARYAFLDSYSRDEDVSFPFLPEGDLRVSFTGRYLSFTGNLLSECDPVSESPGATYYNGLRTISADINATLGLQNMVSAGIGLVAGMVWERENFAVDNSHRIEDFFLNTVTGRYNRVADSEFADVRLGVQFNYNMFTLGIMVPSVFVYGEGEGRFRWEGLSVGITFSGNRYYGRARLNPVVVSAALEARNLGKENRIFSGGLEIMLQFVTDWSVAVRGGYESDPGFTWPGTVTAGIGARMGDFELDLNAGIPLDEGKRYTYSISAAMHF